MFGGQEQVQAVMSICRATASAVGGLTSLDQELKTDAVSRLEAVQEALDGIMDRFFLRTKLCLPLTKKCGEAAKKLEEAVVELAAHPDEAAQHDFASALGSLEKAVKALVDRAAMRGMSIT